MRVAFLIAGAGDMYCGSCLRDHRLAATLAEQGRDISLIPLYTPIRTDEAALDGGAIAYGGVNVYLRHRFPRWTRGGGWLDRLRDHPRLLRFASRFFASMDPQRLGGLTLSVLMGERGPLRAELEKLIDLLKANRPNVVCLPNLMFIGIAERLKASLGVPAVCTLSGEDVFLDALAEPFRRDAWSLIREAAPAVDAFLAVTNDYADHAAARFRLPRDRIHVVPLGVRVEDFSEATPPGAPFTIGYLARICPPKGLAVLAEAFVRLRRSGRDVRLRVAGYVSRTDRPYLRMVRRRLRRAGMLRDVDFVGEVNREEKARFLRSLHVLSVPAVYREAKGLYVLEALACGVPVVQPRHGSFPELVEGTGGGLLYDPAEPGGPAEGIARLMDDPSLRERLARQGRAGLIAHHTDRLMAERTWKLLESVHARAP